MQQVSVIGGGILGLASAVFLQQAGFDVALLDPEPPGSGCSKGNAGHLATEQVFPLAQTSLLLNLPSLLFNADSPFHLRASYLLQSLPWFACFIANMRPARQRANQSALTALNHASMASWQRLLHICQACTLVQYNGALLVSEQHTPNALQQQYRQYRQAGIDVSWCDAARVRQLEPPLTSRLTAALDFTEVGHTIDPYQLCRQLFDHFTKMGGSYLPHGVTLLEPGISGHLITTTYGKLFSQNVVIAAGAHSHLLTKQLGWRVPLEAERGYHLMLEAVPLKRPVSSLERKCIMTPMHSGLRVAGTAEFAGLTAQPDYRRARKLQQHADQLLNTPTSSASADNVWAGNRPSLPDSLPVLGPCPKYRGIYYNFGHQHLGLTQAAFSAELITSCLQRQQPAIDLAPYRINRF